jgi:hypothetical protein
MVVSALLSKAFTEQLRHAYESLRRLKDTSGTAYESLRRLEDTSGTAAAKVRRGYSITSSFLHVSMSSQFSTFS